MLLGCLVIFHWCSKSSPNGVFDILGVESDKEAKDGEEHDTVGCEHQATRPAINLKKKIIRSLRFCRMRGLQIISTVKYRRNRLGLK